MDADTALNGGTASAALNGVSGAYKNVQNVLSQENKAMQPSVDRFRQTASQPIPAVPEPKKSTPAPDPAQFGKDSQGWVMALSAFAALIGSRGRAKGTGALKAYAAGVKGINDGNQQAFKDSYTKWRADTDAMLADNKSEMDKYNAILSNRNMSESEAMQEMKMVAAQHENQTMLAMENYHQAAALRDSIVKARVGAETYIDKLDAKAKEQIKIQEDKDARQDAVISHFSSLKPTDIVPGFGITKAAVLDKVKGLQQGLNYPDVGISMRGTNNPLKDLVDSIKSEMDVGGSRAQEKLGYLEQQAETRAVAARSAPAKIAVKEMDRLGDPMVDAVKKLDPSQYPTWNAVRNAAEKGTGGEDIVRANLAVQEFKTAFTNLMIRNGVPTDAARGKADAIMDVNFSLNQIEAVRDQAKISGAAVLDALEDAKVDNFSGGANSARGGPVNLTKASGEAPEGTIIHNGSVTKVKRGGKWVDQ